MFGFVVLAGCGGTFTRTGDDTGSGGSAGSGASAGTIGHGGAGAIGGTNSAGNPSYGGYTTGGYGNDGGMGATAGSSFGGDGCGPKTSPLGPYPVKFVFSSNTPVYLRFECSLNYNLYACGSSALTRSGACTADCSDTSSGCIACGACAFGAKPVGPGASLEDSWDGRIYSYGTLPSGCPCTTGANAAPGMYTIGLSEFFSEADALANTNGYPRQVQFQLPAPNGVVQVDLGFIGI
jgi:hypothetical protein